MNGNFDTKLVVANSLSYPYERVDCPYLFKSGGYVPIYQPFLKITKEGPAANESPFVTYQVSGYSIEEQFMFSSRLPVIAVGANASPTILRRKSEKYGRFRGFPVVDAVLVDFSVVYSAHISSNGSVPVTLEWTKDARARASVMFIHIDDLPALNESELIGTNYFLGNLTGENVYANSIMLDNALFYGSKYGAFLSNGLPVSPSFGSMPPADKSFMSQKEIQLTIMKLLGITCSLQDFVFLNAIDGEARTKTTECLKRFARPIYCGPDHQIVEG